MTISKEELRLAKKGGFKKKAPRKPKKYTESQMINYLEKYKNWAKELKDFAKRGRKLDNLMKQVHATRHYR
tara:strand:+ start:86 stop:298 length:213 start_codon:yes stop_codon:yes gene_type:complete